MLGRYLYYVYLQVISPTTEQHVSFCALWRRPSLRSLPTRAMGSALCVMGGRLWFLGHAYSSYTCTGSALDVMDYRLAKAKSSVTNYLLGRYL